MACGYHVFPKHYVRQEPKEQINAAVLPTDFSREIPSHALKWLLQYELPLSYWRPFIGWSEKDMRLVITVGKGPEFSIGRYLPSEGRSSTNERQPRKWYVWGNCHKHAHILGDYTNSQQIVLVEDVISACKVAKITACVSLFGTTIFNSCIPILRYIGLPIVLWLDKDQEHTMPKKCNWLSLMAALPCRYVVTDNDPKECSFTKIKEVLNA
jgi:hypothetical protein